MAANFQSGAAVRLGGISLTSMVLDAETIAILAPAHAAGTVDVIVTNPGGMEERLVGGYAFASPETFDFNGDWTAHVGPDYEMDMGFTIRNTVLVNVLCNMSPPLTLAAALTVSNGGFTLSISTGASKT